MSRSSRRLVYSVRALCLLLIALHLAAPLLPEEQAWGLWPFTYLPVGWRWVLALLATLTCLPLPSGLRRRCDSVLPATQIRRRVDQALGYIKRHRRAKVLISAGLALSFAPLFWFGRLVHTRWGDAYILVNAIPHPEVRLTYNWQAPLDIYLHAKTWALGHWLFGWPDAMPAYWLLSTLAGVVFIFVLARLADDLGRDRGEKLLVFGLIATLGTMQLFFGYVESYTFICLGILAYLWLALRCLRGETDLWYPASVLALTHGFHPSTLVLQPSLWYLGWVVWSRRRLSRRAVALRIVVPSLLVGGGVLLLMEAGGHGLDALLGEDFPGGGDHRWLVPLLRTTTRWERYTMFSWPHLLDIINEQLLTAPVVLPALVLVFLWTGHRLDKRDQRTRFLVVAAGCYLLLTLIWNPDYGGRRDWDLFAPASLPLTLLLAYVLPRTVPERPTLRRIGLPLIAVQLIHTAAWVYQNTRPWSWPVS